MIYTTARQQDPARQTSGGVQINPGFLATAETAAESGFQEFTSLGALNTLAHGRSHLNPSSPELTKAQWEMSPWYRQGVPYHPGMTIDNAQYLAHAHDTSERRSILLSHSDHWGAKILGSVVGMIPDPLNFIGLGELGDAIRGIDYLKDSPLLAKAAAGAAGAGVAVGAAQPLVVASQKALGHDYDWKDALYSTLQAASVGAGLGALAHGVGRVLHDTPIEDRVKGTRLAAAQLSKDEPVDVAPYIRSIGERVDIRPAMYDVPDEIAGDESVLARRVVDAKAKPGFLRTADEKALLDRVQLTPDQNRAVDIMSHPSFTHTAEDKVFIKAFEQGDTKPFHEATAAKAERIVHSKANYVTRMDAAARADEARKAIDINEAPKPSDWAPQKETFKPVSPHDVAPLTDAEREAMHPEDVQAYDQAQADAEHYRKHAKAYMAALSCL